jgi:2-keto-4-pentenoate hydratase/2-oxohepta-3-ene-1,7-dioic acid hydratase in catechol pathway
MAQTGSAGVTRYVRYEHGGAVSYGVLEGENIKEIQGGLFGERALTGKTVPLGEARLKYPCEPKKILAVGLNYRSHIGNRPAPTRPEIFYKPPTSLLDPGGEIVLPPDSKDVHYEGEFVIVISRTARKVSVGDAPNYIFGYTCGNDVSDRNWQHGSKGDTKDTQWWRAKGSDTFGPLGPAIAVGLDYNKSRLTLRLNGEVKQTQLVSDLIFGPNEIVSYVSQYVTLTPGDVIYTGTPGRSGRVTGIAPRHPPTPPDVRFSASGD